MNSYTHTTWNGWRAPVSGTREWSIKCASSRMTLSPSPTPAATPSRSSTKPEPVVAPSTRAASSIPIMVGERVKLKSEPGKMPIVGVLRSVSHTTDGISVEIELQTIDGKRIGWTHGDPDTLGMERW
jgi:hypothetical protein